MNIGLFEWEEGSNCLFVAGFFPKSGVGDGYPTLDAGHGGRVKSDRSGFFLARWVGMVSIYALTKALGRNYSNVHADVSALLELGLIARTPDGVSVPWEAVEWRLSTAVKAA